MAVFTIVTPAEAAHWLSRFDIGQLTALEGIRSGIENTNYFVNTDGAGEQQFVLTIFERLSHAQLPFYLEFMRSVSRQGINAPRPIEDATGAILHTLHDKPCALATRLPGASIEHPTAEHTRQVGAALARLHAAGKVFEAEHPALMQDNLRGLRWWTETTPQVLPHLDANLQALLRDELQAQRQFATTDAYQALPRGPVHADLFRNNVLFAGSAEAPRLGGFIDFYFAGVDHWLFDLAVTANDWCIDLQTGAFEADLLDALLNAYAAVQPFTEADRGAWQMMLRAAALRFWLSRLYDYYQPREALSLQAHDPTHFERILLLRRTDPTPLPAGG